MERRNLKRRWISLLLALAVLSALLLSPAAAFEEPSDLVAGCSQSCWEILKYTNKQRIAAGTHPLSTFDSLQAAAAKRAEESAGLFSHTRPDGSICGTVLAEYGLGYTFWGENLARGYTDPERTVRQWMESEGHRENLLDTGFAHVGVGNQGMYWSQLFLTDACRLNAVEVVPGSRGLILQKGESVDDLNAAVKVHCKVHGDCYLPLIAEMCSGADTSAEGVCTVTVNYGPLTAEFDLIVTEGSPFADLSAEDPCYEAVVWCAGKDLLTGYEDGSFRPDGQLTRAEGCTILTRLMDGTMQSAGFLDTEGHWADGCIGCCAARGIVNGYGNGCFGPDDKLTGYQWVKMALCTCGVSAEETGMTGPEWEAGVQAQIDARQLTEGMTDFAAGSPVSRAQACEILWRISTGG